VLHGWTTGGRTGICIDIWRELEARLDRRQRLDFVLRILDLRHALLGSSAPSARGWTPGDTEFRPEKAGARQGRPDTNANARTGQRGCAGGLIRDRAVAA
jgi:hypothetical protein